MRSVVLKVLTIVRVKPGKALILSPRTAVRRAPSLTHTGTRTPEVLCCLPHQDSDHRPRARPKTPISQLANERSQQSCLPITPTNPWSHKSSAETAQVPKEQSRGGRQRGWRNMSKYQPGRGLKGFRETGAL